MTRIAVNGVGKVGKALLEHLKERDGELAVVYLGRSQSVWFSTEGTAVKELPAAEDLTFRPVTSQERDEILDKTDVDVWFELTPTDLDEAETVFRRILGLLERGISVILATKSPVLHDYMGLKTAAERNGARLGLSAVMGASLPSYALGHYGAMGSEIRSMAGILNGTSNFVLALMEAGNSFAEAIAQAVATGIAEPNWSYDVDGLDSAIKMTILASVILNRNVRLDRDNVQGLRSIDPLQFTACLDQGRRYKLVAEFRDGEVSVSPRQYQVDDLFYHVNGANKALRLDTTTLSDMTVIGGKSGLPEVAASMYRDLCWMREDR